MTIEQGTRSYECTNVGAGSGCREATIGTALPASEVLRVAVATGAYDVVRQPDRTIAGMRARCFRVRARPGAEVSPISASRPIGASAPVGSPCGSSSCGQPGIVDEQVAAKVRLHATNHDVDTLARSFAPGSPDTRR